VGLPDGEEIMTSAVQSQPRSSILVSL